MTAPTSPAHGVSAAPGATHATTVRRPLAAATARTSRSALPSKEREARSLPSPLLVATKTTAMSDRLRLQEIAGDCRRLQEIARRRLTASRAQRKT